MREKLIDSALLIGLVVVCAVIVVTLFFPGVRGNRRAAVTATPLETVQTETTQTETPRAATPQIEVAPGQTGVPVISSAGRAATPEAGTEPQTEAGAETVAEPAPEASPGVETTEAGPAESEATAQPLPEGGFDLERVGFSFAGVMGACSVELEPWRHVAVSRDILAEYPCGSEITVALDEPVAGRSSFRAVVGDTMNPSNVRTVNIYVAPDEPALQYGVAAGRLEP